MELVESPPLTIEKRQTRATFELSTQSVLKEIQIADELGFAYLTGDIDFGAVGRDEIFQCIRFIILTEYFSVPLDREFGFDYSMIDKPMAIAEAVLAQEVAMKISLYEPRAQFRSISYVRDEMIGKLSPSVVVALLTTNELPPVMRPSVPAAVVGAPGKIIEEVDLPAFYATLVELAKLPGPAGPTGPIGLPGPAGPTGQTWRGVYDPAITYYPNDAVEFEGSTFICLAETIGNEPVPDTASNLLPPLADTEHGGSVRELPPSDQTTWWLRGDNTWQKLPFGPGMGDVTGPAGATVGEIATYENSTGKLLGRLAPPAGALVGTTAVQTLSNKTIPKSNVGLDQVDNTSDAAKNAAAATLTNKIINGANNTLTIRADLDLTGNLPIARFNGGVGADASSYWKGNGTWGAGTEPVGAVVQVINIEVTAEILIIRQNVPPLTPAKGDPVITGNITRHYSNSKVLVRAGGQFCQLRSPVAALASCFFLFVPGVTNAIRSKTIFGYGDSASQEWNMEFMHAPAVGGDPLTYLVKACVLTVASGSVGLYINDYQYVSEGYAPTTWLTLEEIKQ